MCDFAQGIKFCTCPSELENNLSHATWMLKRYMNQDWMSLDRGRCSMAAYENSEQANAELIWLHLNTQDCFDFNYKPVDGDVLNIQTAANKDKTVKYEFIFTDNQWQLAESISDHLNAELVIYKGYLKNEVK